MFIVFFLGAYFLFHVSSLTAAIIAVACAFVVSVFFLRGPRDQATAVIADRFAPNAATTVSQQAAADADVEDALVDAYPDVEVNADRHSKDKHFKDKDDAARPESYNPGN